MSTFLLTYDLQDERIVAEQVFGPDERSRALSESTKIQRQHWGSRRLKILTLFADRREDLLVTHPNYFARESSPSLS